MAWSQRKLEVLAILVVAMLACGSRLAGLGRVPDGALWDEASNAYDAYCIAETGQDRWGHSWPMFLEAFGRSDYRPATYAYFAAAAVSALGPDYLVVAMRLPAALCSLATILCLYWLVRRLYDRWVALAAALLLVLSPWHLYLGRFGHESSLTPLFPVLALLMLSMAGWPLRGGSGSPRGVQLRWDRMALFGAVVGFAPYTYASLKLFMPAFLLALALIYWRVWPLVWKDWANRTALLAAGIGCLLVSAPMASATFAHWDQINARAEDVSWFHQGLPLGQVLANCARGWAAHFSPWWLFIEETDLRTVLFRIPGVGRLNWYMAVLVPIGLAVMWRRRRENRAYLALLAWLLLHPVAAALTQDAPHPFRAACGLGSFQWAAGVGLVATGSWLIRNPSGLKPVILPLVAAIAVNAGWAQWQYFSSFGSNLGLTYQLQSDLREALESIRGRWRGYDRVFITDHEDVERRWLSICPYIYVLLYLPVEPAEFHRWSKEVVYDPPTAGFHKVRRMGPFTMSTRTEALREHFARHPRQRVLFVARPGDISGGVLLETIPPGSASPRFEIIAVNPP